MTLQETFQQGYECALGNRTEVWFNGNCIGITACKYCPFEKGEGPRRYAWEAGFYYGSCSILEDKAFMIANSKEGSE